MTPPTSILSPAQALVPASGRELDQVVREFPVVLERLRAAYEELESRAARVEGELEAANRELGHKVSELDRLLRERSVLDERLHAADKMAALGTLAAGIAHEIRNPLNAVRGFAALLLRRTELDPRFHRWCQLILDGTSEADEIIENMLSFGSPERLRLEAIRPEELLEDARRAALAAEDSRLEVELATDAPPFLGDRIKLRQAIRNLIANALAAQVHGARGGRVSVELARRGGALSIRVADAGPGVPASIRARIFDPFYTTRPEGTGLGLALVAVIARLHGGEVSLSPDPSPLGGAEFELRLPFHPADPPAVIPLSQD
jgi:signal transduction histidine kinase